MRVIRSMLLVALGLVAGEHRLAIVIDGANASAIKSHLVGLDYLRLVAK